MGIKYFIFQTRLQGEPKFFGRVILKGTLDQTAMIKRMLDMGTSLTKPDITAVLQLLSMAVQKACSEGYKVKLDTLVQLTPVVGGEFNAKNDSFTSPRNSLYLTSQVSKALNAQVASDTSVERVIVDETRPILLDVINSEGDSSDQLAPGNIVSITGKRLKFDAARPEEYLRLVNLQAPSEFVPITRFHRISNQELVFRLPPATFAEGYFELATSLNTTSIRVGRSAPFPLSA